MSTGDRIRSACEALALSQAELARRIGMAPQDLQRIVDGRVRRSKHLPAIAEALSVDLAWLTTGAGAAPSWAGKSTVVYQQVDYPDPVDPAAHYVGTVSAGGGLTKADPAEEAVPITLMPGLVVYQIEGDSAYPVAWPGQWALCDPNASFLDGINNGNLVVVETTDGRAYLKRYVATDLRDKVVLVSVNIGRDAIVLDPSDILSAAKVVGILHRGSLSNFPVTRRVRA